VYFLTNVRERAKMMRKNDANHEIEIPITKTQVPNNSKPQYQKMARQALALFGI